MKSLITILLMLFQGNLIYGQETGSFWKDTLCQNTLRLNYSPLPFTASVQTPPVYDFIGNTMVQVYSGIASSSNDTNLSFLSLVNGFGNVSLNTASPLIIKKSSHNKLIYYNDLFTLFTGTMPNQTGVIEELLGTIGFGLNTSFLLSGELNKLHFVLKHRIGASYGNYPGLIAIPSQKIIFYQNLQFRIKSINGALVFDFPMAITRLNIDPILSIGYYQKL